MADQSNDPFAVGGPGGYGSTMTSGMPTRRRHISERGKTVDGRPLPGDPLETLKQARARVQAQVDKLTEQLHELDARIERLLANEPQKVRGVASKPKSAPAKAKKEKATDGAPVSDELSPASDEQE